MLKAIANVVLPEEKKPELENIRAQMNVLFRKENWKEKDRLAVEKLMEEEYELCKPYTPKGTHEYKANYYPQECPIPLWHAIVIAKNYDEADDVARKLIDRMSNYGRGPRYIGSFGVNRIKKGSIVK